MFAQKMLLPILAVCAIAFLGHPDLATEADALVSTDAGCLMNIGGRLHREGHDVEVLHFAELLDRRG